jgi:hypothetical protein
MLLYSQQIIRFIEQIKALLKEILEKEARLPCTLTRFYDRKQKLSYPIKVVVYNNKKMLGYFDPSFYELGFHTCLMQASKKQLCDVIRHELAHYLTWIEHGAAIQAHGAEFKTLCQQMGWGEEVSRATTCLQEQSLSEPAAPSGILRKVQKLLALSTSTSQNEAEQAVLKARQLLFKYNLDPSAPEKEDFLVLKRIFKQRKENGKMRAIAKILETFFVSTVYNRVGKFTYLEILGQPVNVEIADYVASVLDGELDRLWSQVQKENRLRGMVAKNSFFRGLAKGYCDKIQHLQRDQSLSEERALMIIEKQLAEAVAMAYPRLSSVRRSARSCKSSSALGEQMGRTLQIQRALRPSSSKTLFISLQLGNR